MTEMTPELLDAQRRIETGKYLAEVRDSKRLSQAEAARGLDVSGTYLSYVERGMSQVSDQFIRKLAQFYELDESDLFLRYGKTPLFSREILDKRPVLTEIIKTIEGKNIPDERKEAIYNEILKSFQADESNNKYKE